MVVLVILVLVDAYLWGVPFEVLVQIATVVALIFPLYSWEKERLDKRYEQVDDLRVWADHFDYMTKHFQQIPSGHILGDEVKAAQGLATSAADHLALALARCVTTIGSKSDLAIHIVDFILALRKFAMDDSLPGNIPKFLSDLGTLQPFADDIGNGARAETRTRFRLRYAVPQPLLQLALIVGLLFCMALLCIKVFF